MLKNLIQTVGLDKSFFFQLVLAVILYFISKKILFEPFLNQLEEREKLTKGRLSSSKDIDSRLEEKKKQYERQAQKIHTEFQDIFNGIKNKTQEHYTQESLRIKKEQDLWLKQERDKLKQAVEAEEQALQKDLPSLAQMLADKIKS